MWRLLVSLLIPFAAGAQNAHPILAIGSPAPNFSLPGVDGKTHGLTDYSSSAVLVVVFTCNHCPIAQMYEQRIQQLSFDSPAKCIAKSPIHLNYPQTLRIV